MNLKRKFCFLFVKTSRRRHRFSSDSPTPPQSISPQSHSSNSDHIQPVQCHRTLSSSRGRPIKARKDDYSITTTVNVNIHFVFYFFFLIIDFYIQENPSSQQDPIKEDDEHHSVTVLCSSNEVYAVSQV